MAEKSVIIIGAGLAGLSTGCYARMNGYKTHIFEHHSRPGGVAAAWRCGEYLIDGGIHFIMGHKEGRLLYEIYEQLGIFESNKIIDMATYAAFTDENSGQTLRITGDLDRLSKDLNEISPPDMLAIEKFINAVRSMQNEIDLGMGLEKPPELTGLFGPICQFWRGRGLFRYMGGKYNKPVAEYTRDFRSLWLRDIINNMFLPEVPMWFVLMLLAAFAEGQFGLIEGGCRDFVGAIEKRYRSLGGKISYNSTVGKILVDQDKAVGVRLADGGEIRADIVVSAADGYSTIYEMLGKRYMNQKIQDRYKNWKLFKPLVMVNLGVAREFPDDSPITLIKLSRPLRVGDENIDWAWLRIFNYSGKFAPPGKTVVQCSFESRWSYWNDMQERDRAGYDAAKQNAAAEALNWLEERYPGISSLVEVTDVSTPYTTWRYTRNRYGSYEGFLPTPEVVMQQIRRTLPGLKNFYMAGQWVMPGGGVPLVLYSGRHAVQIMCHRDRKGFRTDIAQS